MGRVGLFLPGPGFGWDSCFPGRRGRHHSHSGRPSTSYQGSPPNSLTTHTDRGDQATRWVFRRQEPTSLWPPLSSPRTPGPIVGNCRELNLLALLAARPTVSSLVWRWAWTVGAGGVASLLLPACRGRELHHVPSRVGVGLQRGT